jgi:hypothetical protein
MVKYQNYFPGRTLWVEIRLFRRRSQQCFYRISIELGIELRDQVCWELNKAAMLIDGYPGDSEWVL